METGQQWVINQRMKINKNSLYSEKTLVAEGCSPRGAWDREGA